MDLSFAVLFVCAICTCIENQRRHGGGGSCAWFVGLAGADLLHKRVSVRSVHVPSASRFTKALPTLRSTSSQALSHSSGAGIEMSSALGLRTCAAVVV